MSVGGHFREKLTEHILKNLGSGSDRDRVEGLIVTNHLLSGAENILLPRIADIVAALRALLPVPSVKVSQKKHFMLLLLLALAQNIGIIIRQHN